MVRHAPQCKIKDCTHPSWTGDCGRHNTQTNRSFAAQNADLKALAMLTAAESNSDVELQAAIAHWSVVADRHHPAVQPLVNAAYTNPQPVPGPVYRGFVANIEDGSYYPNQFIPGTVVDLCGDVPGHQVVSTSTDAELADMFTWDDSLPEDDPNYCSVFVTINDAHGVDLTDHSEFPDQAEWLITGRVRIDEVHEIEEPGFAAPRYEVEATWLPYE